MSSLEHYKSSIQLYSHNFEVASLKNQLNPEKNSRKKKRSQNLTKSNGSATVHLSLAKLTRRYSTDATDSD